MRLLHHLPIGRKLTLIIFISNLVLLILVFAVDLYWEMKAIKHNTIEFSRSQIKALTQDFTKILLFDSPHLAADVISRLKVTSAIDNVFLYDMLGKPVLSYTRAPEFTIKPPDYYYEQPTFDEDFLHIFDDVLYEGKKYGAVYYRVSTDLLQEKLDHTFKSIILLFFAAMAISLVLSMIFQRAFSQPIVALSKIFDSAIGDRDLNVHAITHEQNEIGKLYKNFNRMVQELRSYHVELTDKNQELELHRNHLEELVEERTQTLMSYTDELESFSYSISHDLRTPLRAINGYCAILLEDYSQAIDAQGKELLDRVRRASVRMGELIDDLLMLSRITQHELSKKHIDFTQLCSQIVSDIEQSYPGTKPIVMITPGMQLYCDPNLIHIAMENLIGNAFKYSGKQPQPQISIRLEHIHDAYAVSVKDNGVGFNNEYSSKLFKPFERLHDPALFEGTGIGLAIVQRVVTRHGGKVWAHGKQNVGSTFYFSLPLELDATNPAEKKMIGVSV